MVACFPFLPLPLFSPAPHGRDLWSSFLHQKKSRETFLSIKSGAQAEGEPAVSLIFFLVALQRPLLLLHWHKDLKDHQAFSQFPPPHNKYNTQTRKGGRGESEISSFGKLLNLSRIYLAQAERWNGSLRKLELALRISAGVSHAKSFAWWGRADRSGA